MKPRTSRSHPLEIATLEAGGSGRIGMTLCPGKQDPHAMTGPWSRDLMLDLEAIRAWSAAALVTLMETHELEKLGVADLGARAQSLGLVWQHLPIRDVSIPGPAFEQAWEEQGGELRGRLRRGEGIVIHCRGGLGRTGMIAVRLLIELGEDPATALRQVREARPGAVETKEQEEYVLVTVPGWN